VKTVQAHTGAAELGPYRHYMQKEIFKQPRAIGDTLEGVTSIMPELFGDGAYNVFKHRPRADPGLRHQLLRRPDRQVLDRIIAKIPVNVEIASEYRYRDSVPNPNTLVVTISQSGETADTMGAQARRLGMSTR
jgi:glucosamine--fructose-6-phosphate aminotransferase (isomerizing)